MVTPYKNRSISIGQVVEVYRNLNKPNQFSIRCASTKLVLAHGNNFLLLDGITHVNQSGRRKVLETEQRTVHAWIKGRYGEVVDESGVEYTYEIIDSAFYSPYVSREFVYESDGCQVGQSNYIFRDNKANIVKISWWL